jgi:hypothetical protein
MAKDRLDGSKRSSLLYEAFVFPGRVILWVKYMNPPKGYRGTRAIARHARSPIMTFLYSVLFWIFAAFVGLLILGSVAEEKEKPTTPTHTTKTIRQIKLDDQKKFSEND